MSGPQPPGEGRAFGGRWTEERLSAIEDYLRAYTTALRRQPFELAYIDAFAGRGWSRRRPTGPLDALDPDDTSYREGSPGRALQVGGFHRYVFVDKSRTATDALERLRVAFPTRAARIEIITGDANVEIPKLCTRFNWASTRGVVYFDPFGLELAWTTLEAVARTNLDVWLLFPVGFANRLMTRTAEVEEAWGRALDRLLGGHEWHAAMYHDLGEQLSMNGTTEPLRRKETWLRLLSFVQDRLGRLFAGGVAKPVVQLNSRNVPLFAVFFAVANAEPKARRLAHRMAGHILNGLRSPEDVTW